MTEELTNELNKQLIEVLKGTTETVSQAKEFIIGELPDVVYQLLLWYGAYNAIVAIIGIVVFYLSLKYTKQLFKKPEKGKTTTMWEWSSIDDAHTPNVGFFILLVLWIPYIISINMMNITWLKIWIAPKIWLIEYTATLAKGVTQ